MYLNTRRNFARSTNIFIQVYCEILTVDKNIFTGNCMTLSIENNNVIACVNVDKAAITTSH